MKKLLIFGFTLAFIASATLAFAERGHGRNDRGYTTKGAKIERHLDRKGDRIEHRFQQKARRADVRGHYRKADQFRAKGARINRHLDRKGDRMRAYYDRRHRPVNHRHRDHRPRVIYRGHHDPSSAFSVMISQPGFLFGWGWYD
ncbi:MAG: hypothetical protein P8Y91_05755 [Desulfuromonadales bacterium]